MITEQQKQVREQLIELKTQIEKEAGNNPLYKIFTSRLDGLIKDMGSKEFSQEKLDAAKNIFDTLAMTLGVK
jgi:hypothetical protein